ncbi:MAG: RhuM family protein [Coriobacteriales bacterium]|nr:RhuM family protein [Coriobacteriales bacterium]
MDKTKIVLFESSDGMVTLPVEVDVSRSEVWLTRQDMAQLFGRDVKTIGKHVNNALREELAGMANRTVAKFATVQQEGDREVTRQVEHYGIDVILSVGYRVKSKRGIEFRSWANGILRDYLTKGFAANERRLRQLGQIVEVMGRLPEGDLGVRQVLDIVQSYSQALDLLDDYDNKTLTRPRGKDEAYVLTYDECRDVIAHMRFGNESSLFGVEKDDSFKASIGDIYAGFAGQDAYPSVEEKAANLLYFIVKNHSFLDGNKRIGAALFLYFLDRNDLLFDANGRKLLADEVLVATTIMIAESRADEKEAMVSLVVNFLRR